jgi:hypothetical protein
MGDRRKRALRVQFDGRLRLELHGANITSDAGLLAFRGLDEAFRLTEQGSSMLSDPRPGKNTQHTMLAVLRQAAFGRLAGYEDVNDAERLRVDPARRRVVGGRAKEREAASTSEMSRVYRNQHGRLVEEGGEALQRVRYGRATDQARQVCGAVDAAVVRGGQPVWAKTRAGWATFAWIELLNRLR